MSAPSLARLHAVVTGRVQGVGFRFTTVDQARRLGVRGWVRNRVDGSVEVEAEGERAALEALAGFLQEGPRGAWVDHVAVTWEAHRGDLGAFGARS
jgi:acylphosphatase